MRIVAPKRERRGVLRELTKFHTKSKESRRFIKAVISGKIDPYVDYKIKKNRFGKFRSISSPFPQLKGLQKQILQELYGLQCHSSAHAYVPNSSVVTAANQHLGMAWGIKLDLEDFFHHVTARHVERALLIHLGSAKAHVYAELCTRIPNETRSRIPEKYNRRHSLLVAQQWRKWLKGLNTFIFGQGLEASDEAQAKLAVTFKLLSSKRRARRYLPQGAPTSGYLANLAFASLDRRISWYLRQAGFTYTRYSDDILISTREIPFDRDLAERIIHDIQKLVVQDGFTLNRAKTRILTPGSRKFYLGLIVSGETTRLPREQRERITAELRDIKKFGFDSQKLRFEEGKSRIRRNSAKDANFENGYWSVLHGFLCWVETADLKLFQSLKEIYGEKSSNEASTSILRDDPDVQLLAQLFERRNDQQNRKDEADSGPSVKIVDINLDF
jgi:RNA-directed DNA polymerase